jgi:hydroxyacylglutathione hydrolase
MIVEQIWTGNDYRNFIYLIVCPDSGEAMAVDPIDHKQCLARAESRGWRITQILNTHHHHDHTGGNAPMIQATGANLLAHVKAAPLIDGIDRGLAADDVVKVGKSVELLAMDTPGHTMSHICLLSETDPPALISGDTLFSAGAGNCYHGGDPEALFETFRTQLSELPDSTLVYPGHDYIINNLGFTLDREPDNERAQALLQQLNDTYDPKTPLVTTMALERQINTFLRLTSQTVIDNLREVFTDISADPTPKQVFLKLRELRNHW